MNKYIKSSLRFSLSFVFLTVFAVFTIAQVSLKEEKVTLPTYPMGPDEPNALFKDYKLPGFKVFRGDRSVYPYTLQEEFSSEKKDVDYHAVILENQYINTHVFTGLRGRLQGAYDKRNNFDYIYYNHVIKPQDIAIRKAWLSGGLEWNHPGGHGYNQFGKVSHITKEYEDGSKSVVVTEIEPVRNMKWQTEVKLYPERLYLETTCRLYSIADHPMQFASSLNGAMHTSDELEVILPEGTHYTGHGKNTMWEWPLFKGVDYRWLKNIQRTFSIFLEGEGLRQDYWGCYSHDEDIDAGTVIIADHRFTPGKKYFTWGYHDKGRIWDTLLSDNDGGYIELQQQAFWDNLGYGHAWLDPLEVKEFTVYWYPIKNMGGFVKANKDIALNIEDKENGQVYIAAQATKPMKNAMIVVKANEDIIYEKSTDLSLTEPYTDQFKINGNHAYEDLKVAITDKNNEHVISYVTRDKSFEAPPLPKKPEDPKEMTMDELFQKGKSFYQDPFNPESEKYFMEMLGRDSLHSKANRAMGLIYYFRGQYDKSRKYYQASLVNDHLNDGYKAYYYLGLMAMKQGRLDEAKDHLAVTGRHKDFRVLSSFYLGNIAIMEKDYQEAVSLFDEAIRFGGIHPDIFVNKAIALRKSGRKEKAGLAIKEAYEKDPMAFNGITEQWFMAEGDKKEAMKEKMHELFDRKDSIFIMSQLYLETSLRYMELYEWQDAGEILSEAIHYFETNHRKVSPMLDLYLGYCHLKMNNEDKARTIFRKAETRSNKFVFPYRKYSINVLKTALEYHPEGSNTLMYLGNVLAYLRQHREAIDSWKKSVKLDPDNSYALHNLGSASWYVYQDLDMSISYLEKALEASPNDGRLILELDHLYIANDKEDERMELYRAHEQTVRKDDELVLRWVDLLIHQQAFELAVDLMDNTYFFAKEMNYNQPYVHTQYAEAHYGLGEVYLRERKYQEALAEFNIGSQYPSHLNDIYPARPVTSRLDYLKGMAYEGLGNDQKAVRQWQQVIDGNSRSYSESDYYRALALIKLGEKEEGNELLEALIIHHTEKLKNETVDAEEQDDDKQSKAISHYILSRIYEFQGKGKEAKEHFSKATALNAEVIINTRLQATFVPAVDM